MNKSYSEELETPLMLSFSLDSSGGASRITEHAMLTGASKGGAPPRFSGRVGNANVPLLFGLLLCVTVYKGVVIISYSNRTVNISVYLAVLYGCTMHLERI